MLVKVRVSSRGEICLSCSFSADELTGCVGVIHSAQLDNLTLTVLSVERSGGMNCTVDELMEGNYSVAVFGQLPANVLTQEPAYVSRVSLESVHIILTIAKESQPLGRSCLVFPLPDFITATITGASSLLHHKRYINHCFSKLYSRCGGSDASLLCVCKRGLY